MLKINSALLALALLLGSTACASQPTAKNFMVNQYSVEARVVFQPWSTKGFGEQIGTESLTVIASLEERGDIVALRKNNTSVGFTEEFYRPDVNVEKLDMWNPILP